MNLGGWLEYQVSVVKKAVLTPIASSVLLAINPMLNPAAGMPA